MAAAIITSYSATLTGRTEICTLGYRLYLSFARLNRPYARAASGFRKPGTFANGGAILVEVVGFRDLPPAHRKYSRKQRRRPNI